MVLFFLEAMIFSLETGLKFSLKLSLKNWIKKYCFFIQGEGQSVAADRPSDLRTEDAVNCEVDGREVGHTLPGL